MVNDVVQKHLIEKLKADAKAAEEKAWRTALSPTGKWIPHVIAAADARPDLVKALVSVEPLGPPFSAISGALPYGITHAPLSFDPPLVEGEVLASMDLPSPGPDLVPYKVQAEPARRLPALARMPIVVVTAEASWMAADNHAIVHFLRQAGASVDHLKLADHGIHGNGHAMQLERNSDEVAAVIEGWIKRQDL